MRRPIILVSFAVLACAAASQAITAAMPQLPFSVFFSVPGHLTALKADVTYQAKSFPISIRVAPPDESWFGAQWKSSAHGERSTKPPFFGWVAVGQGPTDASDPPKGLIVVTASYVRTHSVAAAVKSMRTHGHSATYGPTSPVTLAGFKGIQFDGQVTGKEKTFIPFTPPSQTARYYGDANYLDKGDAFRIIVLNVRHKTVAIFIETGGLPAAEFPAFLTKANTILSSLKFPR